MGLYKITIDLLSDMCVSDGGVYNSFIDTDICCDKYGFPYIPAKRIKGCLRESALELIDWGADNIDMDAFFGTEGAKENSGKIKISDAKLENWDEYHKEISDLYSPIYSKQDVLACFSYIRTQTAIERESGVAKDDSLRNMRVADKGLRFYSTVRMPDKFISGMKDICMNVKNIGMKRTRGFGEVNVSIAKEKDIDDKEIDNISCSYENDSDHIEYELYLNEPVICKNVMAEEQRSNDYIEGSKILGIIAERCRENGLNVSKLIDEGNLIFSNAYISKNHNRYTEVPGYIYEIKNDSTQYVNIMMYDKSKEKSNDENNQEIQLNSMKHKYVVENNKNHDLIISNVRMENRYHHRRPDDKSIGHVVENDGGNSGFYQISSIMSDQTFKGYIEGKTEQIKKVFELLKKEQCARIGYGNSAEYGGVTLLSLTASKNQKEYIQLKNDSLIVVTLNSPTIVYSKNATYSTDVQDLVKEILHGMVVNYQHNDDNAVKAKYIKYIPVGGYNVTWNRRKPTVIAYDKGSSIVLYLKKGEVIMQHGYIGERNIEGFGEYVAEEFVNISSNNGIFKIIKENEAVKNENTIVKAKKNSLASIIAKRKLISYLKDKSIKGAESFSNEKNKAVVSNMLLMCEEHTSYEEIIKTINDRYDKNSSTKKEKFKIAQAIINNVDNVSQNFVENFRKDMLIDISEIYSLKDDSVDSFNKCTENEIKYEYLKSLLQQIKYKLRKPDTNKAVMEGENE